MDVASRRTCRRCPVHRRARLLCDSCTPHTPPPQAHCWRNSNLKWTRKLHPETLPCGRDKIPPDSSANLETCGSFRPKIPARGPILETSARFRPKIPARLETCGSFRPKIPARGSDSGNFRKIPVHDNSVFLKLVSETKPSFMFHIVLLKLGCES